MVAPNFASVTPKIAPVSSARRSIFFTRSQMEGNGRVSGVTTDIISTFRLIVVNHA